MTATDELRRLLDERGVEWFDSVTRKGLTWIYRDGKAIKFHPWQPDTLKVSMFDLAPAQAIAATLGPGTCHDKCIRFDAWVCSECGATVLLMLDDFGEPSLSVDGVADVPHFCFNCGRKVVDE